MGLCVAGFASGGHPAMMLIVGIVLFFFVKRPAQEVGGG
jgi:hypothetical protein